MAFIWMFIRKFIFYIRASIQMCKIFFNIYKLLIIEEFIYLFKNYMVIMIELDYGMIFV